MVSRLLLTVISIGISFKPIFPSLVILSLNTGLNSMSFSLNPYLASLSISKVIDSKCLDIKSCFSSFVLIFHS